MSAVINLDFSSLLETADTLFWEERSVLFWLQTASKQLFIL